jgi:hypothetical protein
MSKVFSLVILSLSACNAIFGQPILTNSIRFRSPPEWLTESMLEKATRPVQDFLQWDVRRIEAYYHTDSNAFERIHRSGPTIKAFFQKSDGSIHIGPGVGKENFSPIFSHELVHAVFYQKHKQAIPRWLEEGIANYLSKLGPVDYVWLSQQPMVDVTLLTHPSKDPTGLRFHYQTSTALVEMIASHCSLSDLLMLSVGKKVETYLATLCEISDLNSAYRSWLEKQSKRAADRKSQAPRRQDKVTSSSLPK